MAITRACAPRLVTLSTAKPKPGWKRRRRRFSLKQAEGNMFAGHYAAAFVAKAIEPKTPLWTLAAGCQLIDIGWSSLIMAGVEHASANPALAGSTLVLYDMPWTHSLPGAALWSAAAALLCLAVLR